MPHLTRSNLSFQFSPIKKPCGRAKMLPNIAGTSQASSQIRGPSKYRFGAKFSPNQIKYPRYFCTVCIWPTSLWPATSIHLTQLTRTPVERKRAMASSYRGTRCFMWAELLRAASKLPQNALKFCFWSLVRWPMSGSKNEVNSAQSESNLRKRCLAEPKGRGLSNHPER